MDKIAIVMPVKDMEAFVDKSIGGIVFHLAKENKIDLIVIDDGSTDKTVNIIGAYIDNLKIYKLSTLDWFLKSVKSVGVASARNMALDIIKARGYYDFVAFCDADDVWDPDHLNNAINFLRENNADMVYSDVRVNDEYGNPLQMYGIPYYPEFDRDKLKNGNFIFISTVVAKAKCFDKLRFNPDSVPMEDWDMWLQLSKDNVVVHNPMTTVSYMYKSTGSYYTAEQSEKAKERIQIREKSLSLLYTLRQSINVNGFGKDYERGRRAELDLLEKLDFRDVISLLKKIKDEKNDIVRLQQYEKAAYVRDEEKLVMSVLDKIASKKPGWLSDREGATLKKYAGNRKCLEIGSFKGKSASYIAQVADELTCMDTFKADVGGQVQQYGLTTYNEFQNNTNDFDNISVIIGASQDSHSQVKDNYYDMIFIDAMHDYESVKNDIRLYLPKLTDGGYMLFHDYNNPDWPGVKKAVDEFEGKCIEVVDTIAVVWVSKLVKQKPIEISPDVSKYVGKRVLIAPYSNKLQTGENPKNFPHWKELVALIRALGIYTIQIGVAGEKLIGADEIAFNLTNDSLKKYLDEADTFLSVDSFFQHFAAFYEKKGVVIFSQSDPKIFGHNLHSNVLKSREFLRPNQFELWTQTSFIETSFPTANQVFTELLKILN